MLIKKLSLNSSAQYFMAPITFFPETSVIINSTRLERTLIRPQLQNHNRPLCVYHCHVDYCDIMYTYYKILKVLFKIFLNKHIKMHYLCKKNSWYRHMQTIIFQEAQVMSITWAITCKGNPDINDNHKKSLLFPFWPLFYKCVQRNKKQLVIDMAEDKRKWNTVFHGKWRVLALQSSLHHGWYCVRMIEEHYFCYYIVI